MSAAGPSFDEQLQSLLGSKNFAALADLCHTRELQVPVPCACCRGLVLKLLLCVQFATQDQKDPKAEQVVTLQMVALLLDGQMWVAHRHQLGLIPPTTETTPASCTSGCPSP